MEFPGSLNRWDRYHIITQLAFQPLKKLSKAPTSKLPILVSCPVLGSTSAPKGTDSRRLSHKIHGTGIFTYMDGWFFMVNVG